MRRRIFNLLAAVSLALCLATAGTIWHTTEQRHYFALYTTYANDAQFGFRHNGTCRIFLVDGHLSAVRRYDDRLWFSANFPNVAPRGWSWGRRPASQFQRMRGGTGLWASIDRRGWAIKLPLWLVALVSFVIPAWWALKRGEQWRRKPGLCPACGYDLRATPGRCPECGMDVQMNGTARG